MKLGGTCLPSVRRNVWISWEDHRRSRELSKSLNSEIYVLNYKGKRILRYINLSVKTIYILLSRRPEVLFVQNPSILLSLIGVAYRSILGRILIVDSHTSGIFPFDRKYFILNMLSENIQKISDLTIVTNAGLKNEVDKNGGVGFVLQDKMPNLVIGEREKLKGEKNVVFPCSFSWDEPYLEVIESASKIGRNIYIYITGNYGKVSDLLPRKLPENIVLTGFLSEENYLRLLNSADLVMDLTTREHCLLCGAYEAICLGKPYILSKTKSLMDYFKKGGIYTENNKEAIANAINEAINKKGILENEIKEFIEILKLEWDLKFTTLQNMIEGLVNEKY